MNSLFRLMLIVCALAYGAMPFSGMSAFAGTLSGTMTMQTDKAHGASAAPHAVVVVPGDCPHAGALTGSVAAGIADVDKVVDDKAKPQMTGHCAACLTLAAALSFAPVAKPARAAEAPFLPKPLSSADRTPSVPPPRA